VVAKPNDGPIADFCAELRRLAQRSGLGLAVLASRLGYGRSQLYAILNGNISRPPEWSRLVEPLVRLCIGNDERQVAEWRRRHGVLIAVYEELKRRRRVDPAADQLPAVWNVPLRMTGFVARPELLGRIETRLAAGPVALIGMPGVGKTRLAIEYAYRSADRYAVVRWLDAETTDLIAGQLGLLAERRGLVPPSASVPDAVAAAMRHLRTTPDRWLLVYDSRDRRRASAVATW
jgi:hypothetical protein